MSDRIYFTVWGRGVDALHIPAYAMQTDRDTYTLNPARSAALRSICAANGLAVCGGPRRDTCGAWQVTLGKRLRGGGFEPKAEIWVDLD